MVKLLLIAFVSSLSLSSCRQEEITVRRVPKETVAPLSVTAPDGGAAHREADWNAPARWKEQPASGMRAASYTVPAGDEPIDVSVVPLAGAAGGDLANVNRWRGQLGLAPVDATGLGRIARRATVGTHPALVVEFSSAGKPPRRLLAAVVVHDGTSWFFKAVGPDAAVAAFRPEFLDFVATLRFHAH